MAAKESVQQVEQQMESTQNEQLRLLRRLGDAEHGRSGFAFPGVDGWSEASRKLNLSTGDLRVDVAAATLLRPRAAATLPPSRTDGSAGLATPDASNRWLYPALPVAPFGPSVGDLAATDFTVSFAQDELTGIVREPDATTEKATLSPTVGLATPQAKQFACVLDAVPSKVFDSQDALRAMLGTELSRQLDRSIDAHVVGSIEDAGPESSSTGADLIAKIRNSVSAMRDLGGEPSVIALTPSDAAALDLSTDDGGYVFIPGTTEQAVVWRLQVREAPAVTAPLLIDPRSLGLIFAGEGAVLVDPFTNLSTNQVRVRVELEARMHIRNVVQGAYRIA